MRQGLYTSGFFHIFGGFLLIANFQLLQENPNEVLNKVSVKLLSEQELNELTALETTSALEVENSQPRTITYSNNNPKKIISLAVALFLYILCIADCVLRIKNKENGRY